MPVEPPPIGDILMLAEPDYLYGAGRLILRVEHVDRAHPISYDNEDWYTVRGVQISGTGVEVGDREVVVRGRRLIQ
jgi:hypothetical protein